MTNLTDPSRWLEWFLIIVVSLVVAYAMIVIFSPAGLAFDESLTNTCSQTIVDTNVHPAWNVTVTCLSDVVCFTLSDPDTGKMLAMYCDEKTPENTKYCNCSGVIPIP